MSGFRFWPAFIFWQAWGLQGIGEELQLLAELRALVRNKEGIDARVPQIACPEATKLTVNLRVSEVAVYTLDVHHGHLASREVVREVAECLCEVSTLGHIARIVVALCVLSWHERLHTQQSSIRHGHQLHLNKLQRRLFCALVELLRQILSDDLGPNVAQVLVWPPLRLVRVDLGNELAFCFVIDHSESITHGTFAERPPSHGYLALDLATANDCALWIFANVSGRVKREAFLRNFDLHPAFSTIPIDGTFIDLQVHKLSEAVSCLRASVPAVACEGALDGIPRGLAYS
mmetsp:Transcript_51220/g.146242  ORF Transcript_51220/g.146242 Transcript_51220/m.146242 type:complete len:289 (-) Transcript_51220:885-1751(-)